MIESSDRHIEAIQAHIWRTLEEDYGFDPDTSHKSIWVSDVPLNMVDIIENYVHFRALTMYLVSELRADPKLVEKHGPESSQALIERLAEALFSMTDNGLRLVHALYELEKEVKK